MALALLGVGSGGHARAAAVAAADAAPGGRSRGRQPDRRAWRAANLPLRPVRGAGGGGGGVVGSAAAGQGAAASDLDALDGALDRSLEARDANIASLERALRASPYSSTYVPPASRRRGTDESNSFLPLESTANKSALLGAADCRPTTAPPLLASAAPPTLGPFSLDPHCRGVLMLNALTLLFGSNMALLKLSEGAGGMEPELFTACRFLLAAAVLAPAGLGRALADRATAAAGLELGLWGAAGYATQAMALLTADSSRVSFLSAFTVITVPLLAGLFGKKVPAATWPCAGLAIAGVALLENGGAPLGVGDAWALASAAAFGVHILRSEHYSHLFADPLPVISLQMVTTAAVCTTWAAAQGALPGDAAALAELVQHLPHCLPELLYTGLVTTALSLWLEIKALENVSATEAALIYASEPMWGAAFAWVLLGERWGAMGWAGAALIVAGSCLSSVLGDMDAQPTAIAKKS